MSFLGQQFFPLTGMSLILIPIPTCEFANTTKQFSHTSYVSYNSTQFWHCLAGDIIVSHSFRARSHKAAPLQMSITSPGCSLCFWPTDYKSEVPTMPSLGSINLLEWLVGLRNIALINDQFMIKRYNSETARWKRCTGKSVCHST